MGGGVDTGGLQGDGQDHVITAQQLLHNGVDVIQ